MNIIGEVTADMPHGLKIYCNVMSGSSRHDLSFQYTDCDGVPLFYAYFEAISSQYIPTRFPVVITPATRLV